MSGRWIVPAVAGIVAVLVSVPSAAEDFSVRRAIGECFGAKAIPSSTAPSEISIPANAPAPKLVVPKGVELPAAFASELAAAKKDQSLTAPAGTVLELVDGQLLLRNESFEFLLSGSDGVPGPKKPLITLGNTAISISGSPQFGAGDKSATLLEDLPVTMSDLSTDKSISVTAISGRGIRLPLDSNLGDADTAFWPPGARLRSAALAALTDTKNIVACVLEEGGGSPLGSVLGLFTIERDSAGIPVSIKFDLPEEALDELSEDIFQNRIVAVATTDGVVLGFGRVSYITPLWAGLAGLALVVVLFVFSGVNLATRVGPKPTFLERVLLRPIYMGADGRLSISLMQITLWTAVVVWSITYVFLRTSSLVLLTTEIMGLLGFAGATAVTARIIAARRHAFKKDEVTEKVVTTKVAPADKQEPTTWAELVQGRGGTFDLVKFQLLVFTLLIAAYTLYQIANEGRFPDIGTEFLLLMGVSNGVYLTNKFVAPSDLDQVKAMKEDHNAMGEVIKELEEERTTLTARLAEINTELAKNPPPAEANVNLLKSEKTRIEKRLKVLNADEKTEGSIKKVTSDRTAIENDLKEITKILTEG